ncbi:MAG: acyl-CoA dehydrogenase family protein [Fimbriiglobus sp.]|nr:acyl-CoA dehydrogenase family protein [Fimbriiglobus sp.]
MALTQKQIDEQKKQVEELLGPELNKLGFAKSLFFGVVRGDVLFPYPQLTPDQQAARDDIAARVQAFADAKIDHMKIDRESRIPDEVVRGLGDLGVLGLTIPKEYGGQGFNQQQYMKTMEVIGGHCASTAVFVNAHHSIGCRALVLFGTKEQQARWLPGLLDGSKLAAFALTEPEAGSDAGGVRTTATPTEDGSAYLLNGIKHYITNGGIADVLTVMARTPDAKDPKGKVTAFLVTPDMPGFEVLEARAEKCGIRGTATGKMKFTNVRVPKENILGQIGRGLQAALTVLNFGRTTFGATCTGHAKVCVKAMCQHAKTRRQFDQTLAEFQLVQKKVAFASAHTFAMEAMTTQCAAFIDRGADDYMLETAILKVFATEHLWTIVNDTLQVYGGKGYFSDQPIERWMRDARINTIGEGANDVLKSFIFAVGVKAPGEKLKGLRDDLLGGRWSLGKLFSGIGAGAKLAAPWLAHTPTVPVGHADLQADARTYSALVKQLGTTLPHVFLKLKDEAVILQAQFVHERLADIAMDLYAAACVLSRLDSLLTTNGKPLTDPHADPTFGKTFLKMAYRRIKNNFAALDDNDDDTWLTGAKATLAKW